MWWWNAAHLCHQDSRIPDVPRLDSRRHLERVPYADFNGYTLNCMNSLTPLYVVEIHRDSLIQKKPITKYNMTLLHNSNIAGMRETENPLVTVCLECTTPLRLKLFGISTSKYLYSSILSGALIWNTKLIQYKVPTGLVICFCTWRQVLHTLRPWNDKDVQGVVS
jgi:hypothetical protein